MRYYGSVSRLLDDKNVLNVKIQPSIQKIAQIFFFFVSEYDTPSYDLD